MERITHPITQPSHRYTTWKRLAQEAKNTPHSPNKTNRLNNVYEDLGGKYASRQPPSP